MKVIRSEKRFSKLPTVNLLHGFDHRRDFHSICRASTLSELLNENRIMTLKSFQFKEIHMLRKNTR